MQVFIVTGEHFFTPGTPVEVFSTLEKAQVFALDLVNINREWVDLEPATDPTKWEAAMEEARRQRAEHMDCDDPDDLEEDDGWVEITEKQLDPEARRAD